MAYNSLVVLPLDHRFSSCSTSRPRLGRPCCVEPNGPERFRASGPRALTRCRPHFSSPRTARAADSRATGIRYGEQDTYSSPARWKKTT
jgi:hypothetical protein